MVARFGIPGEELPKDAASPLLVSAARRALGCAPLSSYLHAITAPMSLSQAWSNITQSVTYTEISFSSDPIVAERQLCN
jgi:arabinofuranosyltransferase